MAVYPLRSSRVDGPGNNTCGGEYRSTHSRLDNNSIHNIGCIPDMDTWDSSNHRNTWDEGRPCTLQVQKKPIKIHHVPGMRAHGVVTLGCLLSYGLTFVCAWVLLDNSGPEYKLNGRHKLNPS